MRHKPKLVVRLVLAGLAIALTGCQSGSYGLTHALWTQVDVREFCMPAQEPHLSLSPSGEDIVVRYDELDEKKDSIRYRAYLLYKNQKLVAKHQKPIFEKPSNTNMERLPEISAGHKPDPTIAICYMPLDGGRQFKIYRFGNPEGSYDLPFYPRSSGTFTRVALTPFAAACDATVVGLVIGSAFVHVQSDYFYDTHQYPYR